MRALEARSQEALGRFELLLTTEEYVDADGVIARRPRRRPWHPTSHAAIRRFIVLEFLGDMAKPYNWAPRGKRKQRMMELRALLSEDVATLGLSARGISQAYLGQLCAAGDGEAIDRSTVREIVADLQSVGLLSSHQPPPGAKLAPYERSGKYAFNQYWLALAGCVRKPSMRGPLDAITDWGRRLAAWWAALARAPEPA